MNSKINQAKALNLFKSYFDFVLKVNLGIKDFETFGFELKNTDLLKSLLSKELNIIEGGNDLMIMVRGKTDMRYNLVNIRLIPFEKEIDEYEESESMAQLIRASCLSDYPVLCVTTNLRNFTLHYGSKTNKDECLLISKESLESEAMLSILYWLNKVYAKKKLLKLEDLLIDKNIFDGIYDAQKHTKEKFNQKKLIEISTIV